MDITRFLKVIKPLLLFGSNKPLLRARKTGTVNKKKKIRLLESFESLLTKLLNEANSLGDPIVKYSDNIRNYLRSQISNNEVNEDCRSYETKCKTEICESLHFVLN